jgi:hypothetical protein
MCKLVFSDKAIFHLSSNINKHNCHIWVLEDPRASAGLEQDSPKLIVLCELLEHYVYRLFYFAEDRIIIV